MKKNNNLKIVLGIVGVVALVGMYFWYQDSKTPGQYDDFAKCLGEKGLILWSFLVSTLPSAKSFVW